MKFFKRLFCKHDYEIKPVHGDMKNYYTTFYLCKKCGKGMLK